MTADGTEKRAVVLSGGGAYGAYEVGILKGLASGRACHLTNQQFDADVFAGTSAGAINAAVFLSHLERGVAGSAEYLESWWLNHVAEGSSQCGNGVYRVRAAPLNIFDPECLLQPNTVWSDLAGDAAYILIDAVRRGVGLLGSRESLTRSLLETIDVSVLFDIRIRESLRQAVCLEGIRRSAKELRVIATNFETGDLSVFNERDVVDKYGIEAILASAAVPAAFPQIDIDGQPHIDGATLLNTPLLGELSDSSEFHVVYMDPDVADIPLNRLQNTIDIIDRLIVVNNAYKINADLKTVMHINESLQLLESLSDDAPIAKDRLKSFYKSVSRVLARVRAGDRSYQLWTVHRYHPREDLGGALGFMNLGRDHIKDLIERGYRDAVEHDCEVSGCIAPTRSTSLRPWAMEAVAQ